MNDRYLFKAKDCNSVWRIGLLVRLQGARCAIEEVDGTGWACDSETLCQCTGLKDKNGTLIWENDVVFVTGYSYIEPEFELNGKVTWSLRDLCFEIDGVPIVESKGSYLTEYHVLGNIFDDPELLEVER